MTVMEHPPWMIDTTWEALCVSHSAVTCPGVLSTLARLMCVRVCLEHACLENLNESPC